jgi:hypothetical protein
MSRASSVKFGRLVRNSRLTAFEGGEVGCIDGRFEGHAEGRDDGDWVGFIDGDAEG